MLILSLQVIMGPKPIKKNNQKDDTANSMSELAFGSTVDEFETGQEDDEYWLDENDEKQLDEMATGYTEMMALTENLRPGWKIFEVSVETDISSLDESVNKSTQENNDPTNNLSVDNKEQKSNNKPQGSSKRKPDCLTPPKPATGPNKATRGDSDAPVASSKSTNTSSSTNSNPKKLQSTSDTSNSADSKDVQNEPDTLSTKEQICSTTQSSGLASANDEQPIQKLKSLVDERIDAHWQHKNIREIFYNGNQKDTEKIFRQLLEKLSKYNNKSGNDTLLRALTQRDDNPAFLTAAEVDDDSISKVVNFLRIKGGYHREKIEQMVKITPLLSHSDLRSVPELIQMETLCSMLLGREGNFGFNFVGRPNQGSKEEMREKGRRLNDYMSQEIEVDGTKVTRRKLAYQKGVETRKKEFQKDGRTTNTYEQAAEKRTTTMSKEIPIAGGTTTGFKKMGRKISATRTRKFQKPDGSWATIATEAVEKSTATMAKEFQNVDGTTTTIFNERTQSLSLLPFFVAPPCSNEYKIGMNCSSSIAPCDILNPCQNYGTCFNNNETLYGYTCNCTSDFSGSECEINRRWNNGSCIERTATAFNCSCQSGWQGRHCEIKINYCENVTCFNSGICRSLLLDYTCECLSKSFTGRHCEITQNTMVIHQMVSKSIGYISIIFIVGVCMFFVIMDILKYCFRIDPAKSQLKKTQQKKRPKKAKRPLIIQKFAYVNASPLKAKIQEESSFIKRTNI
ncbi:unnamed protein product [Adineta steineri]|uniref:EGF-like domain-containing protein n=1 Tax=Adineta steineri TaxID=433720 RepID=A0A819J0R1_9BILA|nr:unnamed protein product [Adineta steineri]